MTKRINLKLSSDLYEWVKSHSKNKNITMTELITRLIERKREEEKVNEPKQY